MSRYFYLILAVSLTLVACQSEPAAERLPADISKDYHAIEEKIATAQKEFLSHFTKQDQNEELDPQRYLQFKDRSEAIEWAKTNALTIKGAVGNPQKFRIVEDQTDSRYAVLQNYLTAIWKGYKELFPADTSKLNEPPVILIETDVVNAFVPKDFSTGRIAHCVIVLSGLIDSAGGVQNRAPISGIIGHELAHSVFGHLLEDVQLRVNKFYVDPNRNPVPYLASRDDGTNKDMMNWVKYAKDAGEFSNENLLNLPPAYDVANSTATRILEQISDDLLDKSLPVCAQDLHNDFSSYAKFFTLFNPRDTIVTLDTSHPQDLQSASQSIIKDATSCFQGKHENLETVLSKSFGVTEALIKSVMADEVNAFNKENDVITAVRDYIAPFREKMRAIEVNRDISKIGYYTFEQHADEVSALIHSYLGLDPTSLSQFFKILMGADDSKKCQSLIDSGHIPQRGSLSDPHPSTCYRIYDIQHLAHLIPKHDQSRKKSFANHFRSATLLPYPDKNLEQYLSKKELLEKDRFQTFEQQLRRRLEGMNKPPL